ncbi:MAG TPA: NAD+ synthase [bacterium]|nr:NAD+ synthase [bacterium]
MENNMTVRVAMAQINVTVGDFDSNLKKIEYWINEARRQQADIVTFPELAVCGYPPEDLLLKSSFLSDNKIAIDKIRHATNDICAIIGFVELENGEIFNSAALIDNCKLVDTYKKFELPNYGVFDEKRYFKQGDNPLVFCVNNVRIAVTICEDIWVERGRAEQTCIREHADVILNISASPFHAGKIDIRQKLVTEMARRTNAFVCYNNLLGGQDELIFDGGGVIAGPVGEIRASAQRFEENMLVADLEIAEKEKAVHDTNGNYYIISPKHEWPRDEIERVPDSTMTEEEEILNALVLGTRDYVLKNGFKKVLLGLSGGIDSALVAAVSQEALGSENVVCVTMPSKFTSDGTFNDAVTLADNLGIKLFTIPISEILNSYEKDLRDALGDDKPGIEHENLQARIRGNILMAMSNKFGWLVLTTGNKSETAVGYSTLYGDMAGGFSVIKDIPKTMVYKLCDYINAKNGKEIIPEGIITRAPSAELRLDQKDEDSLPPYEILDRIIHLYVEEDKDLDSIVKEGYEPALITDVIRLIDRAEFKRRQAPPGIKITPKAFGRDRRLPITNRYRAKPC